MPNADRLVCEEIVSPQPGLRVAAILHRAKWILDNLILRDAVPDKVHGNIETTFGIK